MSRYRLEPTSAQEAVLLRHCSDARYVWNLCCEQQSWWRPGRGGVPGFAARCRQLSGARSDNPWLAEGSVTVQQQAIRDFDQAMRNFFGGTHRKPTWRKKSLSEGFRIVAVKPEHVRRLNRHHGEVFVPKAGWVRFRWSRQVPECKSYRVTRDRAGRWHVAFAAIPEPVNAPGTGKVIGIEDLKIGNMTGSARGTTEAPGRNVRAKAGLNRAVLQQGWGMFARFLEYKAPGRVEKISPAYTSQRCSECGSVDANSRQSQALYACTSCGYSCNADVNAARNIAAGHAARGDQALAWSANREPQRALLVA